MKKLLLTIICVILCLVLVGCNVYIDTAPDTGEVENDDTDKVTENDPDDTSDSESDPPTDVDPDDAEPDVDPSISLVSLRQAMIETPELFAAAYIGLTETTDEVETIEWMKSKAPLLCEDLPFLTAIPESNIIGDRYGELYCIVPADPNASVAINMISFEAEEREVLYRSESGDPVLVFCNQGGFAPDTEVHITDSEGRSIIWYPQLNDMSCMAETYNLDGDLAVMDFTSYDELLKKEYEYYLNDADFWKHPEETDIVNTSWECTEYLMDGTERVYYLDILEDTVNITWNDGIDEENHVYNDAPWKLKTVDGVTVMEIDLSNFEGIRNYCVLITTEHNLMYFSQDFINDDIHNYEKLTRVLQRTFG